MSSFHHHILQIKLLDFNLFLKSSFESKVLFSTCLYKEDFLTAFWLIHVEMAFSLHSHHARHDWSSLEDLWTFKGGSWVAKRSPWSPLWTQQIFHSSRMEWLLLVEPLPCWMRTHCYTAPSLCNTEPFQQTHWPSKVFWSCLPDYFRICVWYSGGVSWCLIESCKLIATLVSQQTAWRHVPKSMHVFNCAQATKVPLNLLNPNPNTSEKLDLSFPNLSGLRANYPLTVFHSHTLTQFTKVLP